MDKEKVKVLDFTIRDGGLTNDHFFDDDFVRAVYIALSASGIDYMEMGYRNCTKLFSPSDFGAWKFCHDDKIKRTIDGVESNLKLAVMVDAHRIKDQEFLPADKSPVDMIRVATYVKDINQAIDMVHKTHDLGYETTVNIMAISREKENDIKRALSQLAEIPVDIVYIVDSFGSFYNDQIRSKVKMYKDNLPGKKIGIHCHNSLQLAFSNTIEGITRGVELADGSLMGIGRGSGNCTLELLMGYLKNPKHDLNPVFKVIQEHLIPLASKIEWGYILPFVITGMLNKHPRSAIAVRKTKEKDDYAGFYEKMLKSNED